MFVWAAAVAPDCVELAPEIEEATTVSKPVQISFPIVPAIGTWHVLPRTNVKVCTRVVRPTMRVIRCRRVDAPSVLRDDDAVCGWLVEFGWDRGGDKSKGVARLRRRTLIDPPRYDGVECSV